MKKITLLLAFTAFSFNLFANDTIIFMWIAGTSKKTIRVYSTYDEQFTIDWKSDGTDVQTFIGDEGNGIPISHTYDIPGVYTVTIAATNATCRFRTLYCNNNQITALDVSNSTKLESLYCSNNQLSVIDISNNIELWRLDCCTNQLSALDVSNNTKLTIFECTYNQLSALDVSNNTKLECLWCWGNKLTALDMSNNTKLTKLWCFSNQLTILDVSNNTKLTNLECSSNQLTVLNVSNNTELTSLNCSNNKLIILDVSNNTELTDLSCYSNSLPLSDLFAISEKISNPNYKCLGQQNLVLLVPTTIGIPFGSGENIFNGIYTEYTAVKGDMPALINEDYIINEGIITFITAGHYTVTMTNDAITSNLYYPAKVTIELPVLCPNATLSSLTISNGKLTPEFKCNTYEYTIDVDYPISSINITANTSYPNSTITGDIGMHTLAVGENFFTITVTAEDGETAHNYIVTVSRAAPNTDATLLNLLISEGELTPTLTYLFGK